MANYIVDASVAVQRLIRDTYTPNARRLFSNLSSDQLYVPEFCLLESTNVLWKQVRFHKMPQADAEQLVADLAALPLQVIPASGLLLPAMQIGLKYQLAVYYSIYIVLAQQLGHPLITVDQSQTKAAIAEGVTLKPITDF